MTEDYSAQPDAVSASALDVISCGLGAGVLLFLVLSVVRAAPQNSAGVEEFIDVTFVTKGNARALITPVIQPPNCNKPIALNLLAIDRIMGRFLPESATVGADGAEINLLKQSSEGGYELLGFTIDGDYRAVDIGSGERHFRMTILRPSPGAWKIGARYFSSDLNQPPPRIGGAKLSGSMTVRTRSKTISEVPFEIGFATETVLQDLWIEK